MICSEDEADARPFCSGFNDRGGCLMGWEDGIRGNDPIMLSPADDVVTCDGFLGA